MIRSQGDWLADAYKRAIIKAKWRIAEKASSLAREPFYEGDSELLLERCLGEEDGLNKALEILNQAINEEVPT